MDTASDRLLTADELADRMRVQPGTIKGWAREGLIPAVRIGGRVIRFDFADVIGTLKDRAAAAGDSQ